MVFVGLVDARRGSVGSGAGDSKFMGKAIERAVMWGMLAEGLISRGASGMTGVLSWCCLISKRTGDQLKNATIEEDVNVFFLIWRVRRELSRHMRGRCWLGGRYRSWNGASRGSCGRGGSEKD